LHEPLSGQSHPTESMLYDKVLVTQLIENYTENENQSGFVGAQSHHHKVRKF
jgi:hypothetical protein